MKGESGIPQHTRRKIVNYAPKAHQKPLLMKNLLTQKLSDQPHPQFIKENQQIHKERLRRGERRVLPSLRIYLPLTVKSCSVTTLPVLLNRWSQEKKTH